MVQQVRFFVFLNKSVKELLQQGQLENNNNKNNFTAVFQIIHEQFTGPR